MLVTTTGSKLWHFSDRFDAEQKLLALPISRDVSRGRASSVTTPRNRLPKAWIPPLTARESARANTFEAVAKEIIDKPAAFTKGETSGPSQGSAASRCSLSQERYFRIGGQPGSRGSALIVRQKPPFVRDPSPPRMNAEQIQIGDSLAQCLSNCSRTSHLECRRSGIRPCLP